MSFGLDSVGWTPKRAADVRESLQDEIVARLEAAGLPSEIDFSRDTIGGILVDALATELGALWEAAGAVFDSTDPANATGILLDNVGAIRGVPRLDATASRVQLTLTGIVGQVVPSGSIVEGGGDPAEPARWATVETVAFDGSGSASVEAVATEPGAITASAGEIVTIVTPAAGWDAVTNPASAIVGRDVERDDAYRRRQRLGLVGRLSVGGIRSAALQVDGVTAAVILQNRGPADLVIGSKTLPPHSVLPVILPAGLTDSQKTALGLVLFRAAAGIRVGAATVDNEVTVEGEGFAPVVIGWDDAGTDPIDVVCTLDLDDDVVLADVQADVEAAVTEYFAELTVGAPARLLAVKVACASVSGVVGATVTLDAVAADYTPALFDVVTISLLTVTT